MPAVTDLTKPYWDGLRAGDLLFQECDGCSERWLPAREHCPGCLGSAWSWVPASGQGRLVSWVIYHHAFHPAFETRLPYNVAVVELDEGPRLISNIVDTSVTLVADMALDLQVESEAGFSIPRFRPKSNLTGHD